MKDADLYNEAYFSDTKKETLRLEMYRQEYERISPKQQGKVLDIGCGKGDFVSMFHGWEKYGIEISDYARKVASDKGIIFNFNTEPDFLDLILFRGTFQHIPDVMSYIMNGYVWLKPGGKMIFLATPNTNGIVYKLFNNLPMISPKYNYILPSDKMLKQILENVGFRNIRFEYPYLGTPYAYPVKNICSFVLCLLHLKKKIDFPFWGNLMECYAEK